MIYTDYEAEYISRIYEPYVYLMTDYGTVDVEFKSKETLTLFKTAEGAVRYLDFTLSTFSVEDYYGDPNPAVDHVKVATPGKYTLVDITNNIRGKVSSNKVYGQFFRNPKPHPTYGEYIGWAYFEPGMVCDVCGGDTTQVDMEYLSGTYHIDCLLSRHA